MKNVVMTEMVGFKNIEAVGWAPRKKVLTQTVTYSHPEALKGLEVDLVLDDKEVEALVVNLLKSIPVSNLPKIYQDLSKIIRVAEIEKNSGVEDA